MSRLSDGRLRLKASSTFFLIFKEKDELSVDEIYAICNKKPDGKTFIRNKLTVWRKQGLAEPVYEESSSEWKLKLIGVKLTPLGQFRFGRGTFDHPETLTLDALLQIITAFKQRHPEFDITFEAHLAGKRH